MSQLDALLARSRSPGTFVEKRSFTLARSKAIEKMREFTLRHPRQYVLELVQAAVFAKARWIAVDVRSDALVVAWVGGKTLSRQQLQDLFDYLFADQGEQDTRHLMQTAVGLNAILQRKPRKIRVESGDGTAQGTSRMDLDKSGTGQVGMPESPLAGTYIYADFGRTWFGRFAGADNFPPEAELVETRCVYTPTPILLNGNAPFGYRSSRSIQLFGVRKAVSFDDESCRGALGLPEKGVAPAIRLVVGGVWISDSDMPELGSPIVGVLADDRLRKTADMSDIVQDGRYIDLLHRAQPHATEMLSRLHGPTYRAPQLPPQIQLDATTATVAQVELEPLPNSLHQIPPRGPVTTAALMTMSAAEPLFWAEQTAIAQLESVCDPVLFPYRVLILTPGQARTLEQMMPATGPNPSRLTNPEDASFVRNAMERRHVSHSVAVEVDLLAGRDRQPVMATLTLTLHLDGPPPRWDSPVAKPGIPVVQRSNDRTLGCHALDLPLDNVSVRVDFHAKTSGMPEADLLAALRSLVQREAWRLLPDSDSVGSDSRRRRLELALLAQNGRPQLFHDQEGVTRMHARLPSSWRQVQDRLLDAPLIETTTGPLSMRGLVALQGSTKSVRAQSSEDRALITPLEARFGFGHVVVAQDLAEPICAVGRRAESWSTLLPAHLDLVAIQQVIILFPSFVSPKTPDGWIAMEPPGPGLVHWRREGSRWLPLATSLPTLVSGLNQVLRTLDPTDLEQRRRIAMSRLALLRLAPQANLLGEVRLSNGSDRNDPATTWLGDATTVVVARGGAQVRQPNVLPLTLDELGALVDNGADLPLLVDDHPDLWSRSAPATGWLARVELNHPGLTGWLGLRLPWDPSPGVLLETSDAMEVLSEFTSWVPCHGLVQLAGADALSRPQHELLQLSGVQLYQRLYQVLERPPDQAHADAARRYAAAFATLRATPSGGVEGGLAQKLAKRVPVSTADDEPWGTLFEWLQSAADARPPPPPGVPAVLGRQRTGAVPDLDDANRLFGFIAGPLERALQAQRPELRLQVHEITERVAMRAELQGQANLVFIGVYRSKLVERAIGGERLARGWLLLDATRAVCHWSKQVGGQLNPLALQQAVLASRIAR